MNNPSYQIINHEPKLRERASLKSLYSTLKRRERKRTRKKKKILGRGSSFFKRRRVSRKRPPLITKLNLNRHETLHRPLFGGQDIESRFLYLRVAEREPVWKAVWPHRQDVIIDLTTSRWPDYIVEPSTPSLAMPFDLAKLPTNLKYRSSR